MQSQTAIKPITSLSVAEARALPAQVNPAKEAMRLTIALTPATGAETMEALQFLFKILPMENAGSTPEEKDEIAEALLAAYAFALRGLPRWAIMEARSNFIAGKVEGQSKDFAPKPPALGHEANRIVDDLRMRLGRAQKQADEQRQLGDERTGPLSDEARERGRRRVAELRASSDEKRRKSSRLTPEWTDPNPITSEMLADIPDASDRDGALRKAPAPSFEPMRKTA